MSKRKPVSDRMMDLTAKIGVHPHHVTKAHAMAAALGGDLSEDECNELINLIGDADASAEEAALN